VVSRSFDSYDLECHDHAVTRVLLFVLRHHQCG
jgi:hypothetical protein